MENILQKLIHRTVFKNKPLLIIIMGRRAPPHPKIKYIIFQVGSYYEKYELKQNHITLISTNAPQSLTPKMISHPEIPDTPTVSTDQIANIDWPMLDDTFIPSEHLWDEF